MELISKLGIDWKLIVSQMINFLILLFILGKFVYKPVFHMLEKRSKLIQEGLENAEKSKRQLEEVEKMAVERMSKAEKQVAQLIDKAHMDAEESKQEIVKLAQKQSEDMIARAKLQIQEEKQKLLHEVKTEVGMFVLSLTKKMLKREFSEADQKRLIDAVAMEMKSASS